MAHKEPERVTPANPQIAKDRAAQEKADEKVQDAIWDATHDKKGDPIPIGVETS